MNPEDIRNAADAMEAFAVVLANYYDRLKRLGIDESTARALTVAMQRMLFPTR